MCWCDVSVTVCSVSDATESERPPHTVQRGPSALRTTDTEFSPDLRAISSTPLDIPTLPTTRAHRHT